MSKNHCFHNYHTTTITDTFEIFFLGGVQKALGSIKLKDQLELFRLNRNLHLLNIFKLFIFRVSQLKVRRKVKPLVTQGCSALEGGNPLGFQQMLIRINTGRMVGWRLPLKSIIVEKILPDSIN